MLNLIAQIIVSVMKLSLQSYVKRHFDYMQVEWDLVMISAFPIKADISQCLI